VKIYYITLVKDVEITPQNPRTGDQIAITIKGECNERVPLEINYEQTVPILDKTFNVQINKIHVPWPKNKLFIEAKNVSTLTLAAKFLLWIHKKVDAINGVAQYTLRDVPKGTYSVKLNGIPMQGSSEVTIKITAFSDLQLDETGSCKYTFHPNPEQGGKLSVKCNQIEKCVEIRHPEVQGYK
jgi:hypothetical protein